MSWADEHLPAEPATTYPDAATWVRDWLAPHYRRAWDTGGRCWCPAWQRHPEARSRLEGLWLAWEKLAGAGGTNLAVWWRDYADPTMNALLVQDGPFQRCTKGHTERLQPLPLAGNDRHGSIPAQ